MCISQDTTIREYDQTKRGAHPNLMHELSIAVELVELVTAAVQANGGGVVSAVHLRLGVLAGVDHEALLFAYDIAVQDTPLAGSQLMITEMPLLLYCPQCKAEVQALSVQALCCPQCGAFSADVRGGRELEIDSVELVDDEPQIVTN